MRPWTNLSTSHRRYFQNEFALFALCKSRTSLTSKKSRTDLRSKDWRCKHDRYFTFFVSRNVVVNPKCVSLLFSTVCHAIFIYEYIKKKKKSGSSVHYFRPVESFRSWTEKWSRHAGVTEKVMHCGKRICGSPISNISCVAVLCLNRLHLSRLIKENEEFFVLIRN